MATITPTSDVVRFLNYNALRTSDTVQSEVDGRYGVLIMSETTTRTPYVPSATPATPPTPNVRVQWRDGTISVVAASTLRRVARGNGYPVF